MKQDHFAQAKVSVRKQIAIPRKVQEKLGGIKIGEYLLFYEESGRVYLEKGIITPTQKK